MLPVGDLLPNFSSRISWAFDSGILGIFNSVGSSTLYTAPITVASNETIKAYAVADGMTDSDITSSVYGIKVATPTLSLADGPYAATQLVTISCTTTGASIRFTTDGTDPTVNSTLYSTPISVSINETIKAYAFLTGMTDSDVVVQHI